jgi:hypothetical protein
MARERAATGETVVPAASAEEAAAIVAALERFARDTAPAPPAASSGPLDPWRRAALLEGVRRETSPPIPEPWINS